jgi:hypothetical protein
MQGKCLLQAAFSALQAVNILFVDIVVGYAKLELSDNYIKK